MIDSSNAFCNKGLGAVSPPPQYCSFPVTVSADSSNRPFSAKNQQKTKKTTAFQRRFPTLFRAVLYAVLCPVLYPMLSTVHSAFSLNRLGGILRPDFSALFQSQRRGAGVYGIKRGDILWWEVNRHRSITASAGWWPTP
jgi:hypothetical protein